MRAVVLSRYGDRQIDYSRYCDAWMIVPRGLQGSLDESKFLGVDYVSDYINSEEPTLLAEQRIASIVPQRLFAHSETDLMRAAALRDRHEIQGPSLATIESVRDKHTMKLRAESVGIPLVRWVCVKSAADVFRAREVLGFPFVLKTRLGGGSNSVVVVMDDQCLREVLRKGLAPSFDSPIHMVAEEYMDSKMVHLDGCLFEDGSVVARASRYVLNPAGVGGLRPVVSRALTNIEDSQYLQGLAQEWVPRFVGEVGDPEIFHLEVFWEPGRKATFCEIGLRPGGAGVADAFHARTGCSYTQLIFDSFSEELFDHDDVGWLSVPGGGNFDLTVSRLHKHSRVLKAWPNKRGTRSGELSRSTADSEGVVVFGSVEGDDVLLGSLE